MALKILSSRKYSKDYLPFFTSSMTSSNPSFVRSQVSSPEHDAVELLINYISRFQFDGFFVIKSYK